MACTSILGSCNAQSEKSSEIYKEEVINHTEQAEDKQSKLMNFITNDSISYTSVLIPDTTTVPFASNQRIFVENITDTDRERLKKIPLETWLQLLEDKNTDWAANLILYDIYERKAAMFVKFDKSIWQEYMKEEDIKYWKEELNKKR